MPTNFLDFRTQIYSKVVTGTSAVTDQEVIPAVAGKTPVILYGVQTADAATVWEYKTGSTSALVLKTAHSEPKGVFYGKRGESIVMSNTGTLTRWEVNLNYVYV